jgi:16S rRNA (guanine527-N7)-methyltransferase
MVPEEVRLQLERLNVSRESFDKLEAYVALLETWQRRINLIGPSTVENIWRRHVLDGAQLMRYLPRHTVHIADLGTGAGIPGLVLAIAGGHRVDLYESNGKKIAFLNEVVRKTHVNARAIHIRIETLATATAIESADCVVSRALAPLPLLLDYAAPFFAQGAKALFHKGQDVDAELTEATKYWKIKYQRHPSLTDSKAVILEIEEAHRVRTPK